MTEIENAVRVHNRYLVECFDKDGHLKWSEVIENTVVTAGLNDLLTQYFNGSVYSAAWYMGLKSVGSIVAADTLAIHANWTEVTAYTGSRPAPTWATAGSGSLTTTGAVSFAMNGAYTVAGAFLCTVASGTAGTLYGGGDFGTARSGASGDTLNVTPTVTAATA